MIRISSKSLKPQTRRSADFESVSSFTSDWFINWVCIISLVETALTVETVHS